MICGTILILGLIISLVDVNNIIDFIDDIITGEINFMKIFNSIQIVTLFGGFPFLLNWLSGNPFNWSNIAFWVALVAYVIMYGWLIYMVYNFLDDSKPCPNCKK